MIGSALPVLCLYLSGNLVTAIPVANSDTTVFGTIGAHCVPMTYACDSTDPQRVLICDPNSKTLEIVDAACDTETVCQFIGQVPYCVLPSNTKGAVPVSIQHNAPASVSSSTQGGVVPVAHTTSAGNIASDAGSAYITYHLYYPDEPLTTVACSDGPNGLITKTGLQSLTGKLWPYVTAWSDITWNSPLCGLCIELNAGGKTVHVTAIDACGPGNNGGTHFDVSPQAFADLFGSTVAGFGSATYQIVNPSHCGM